MPAVVVSDLHLGSRHCLTDEFLRFLDGLPAGATLVLNGDTVDRREPRLPEKHAAVLDRLRAESRQRRIVWLRGNHDATYKPRDPAGIETAPHFNAGRDLFVSHGFDFDRIMPHHRFFIAFFRLFHTLRIALGAPSVHVAFYAKRFPWLYRVLTEHVAQNAVRYAKANGYGAVACGHTHHVEDRVIDGIRYFNTGSWTELPLMYVWADAGRVELRRVEPTRPSAA